MPKIIKSFEQNGVLFTFLFREVNLAGGKKYFVTAFGEKNDKVDFEMKQNGRDMWYIAEPAPPWTKQFEIRLSQILMDEG